MVTHSGVRHTPSKANKPIQVSQNCLHHKQLQNKIYKNDKESHKLILQILKIYQLIFVYKNEHVKAKHHLI